MTRWALITGAAGGIGQALVETFSADGYQVIATDRVPQPTGLPCTHYLQADLAQTVSDEAYANTVFAQIKTWLGQDGLHALINNAAVQILGGVDSLSRQDWQMTLNVNLVAPFVWVQALLPELEQHHGSVVNISSIHAKLTKKNFVAYATSKAALSGMTRAMAVDVGSRIRVNAIEPAAIETEMLKNGFIGDTSGFKRLAEHHPTKSIGKTHEVSLLTLFVTKEKCLFLHGSCISLDGAISSLLHDPN
jgi:NAD(P)-dependent dehydrogenase (short-subunit alcohol dehydrogenase family)